MTKHPNDALNKPADDDRIIFIDLNSEPEEGNPRWIEKARRRLKAKEHNLAIGQDAYVFITNIPFHWRVNEIKSPFIVYPYGLGIADFERGDAIRLSEWYRRREKHKDIYQIIEALKEYPAIPDTFDGKPISEMFAGTSNRIRVGQPFEFVDDAGQTKIGTVSYTYVHEDSRALIFTVYVPGEELPAFQRVELSLAEFNDYKRYGYAYFSDLADHSAPKEGPQELYVRLVSTYLSQVSHEQFLKIVDEMGYHDFDRLSRLDHRSLVLEVCEDWVLQMYSHAREVAPAD
jgi:hypothetical protein